MARSSSGLGRRPLKAEISSSNLLRATKKPQVIGYAGGLFSSLEQTCANERQHERSLICSKRPSGAKMTPEERLRTLLLRKGASDENMTPKRGFPTGFRTRCALRRQNDAGGKTSYAAAAKRGLRREYDAEEGVPDGIPYEMRPPAPK